MARGFVALNGTTLGVSGERRNRERSGLPGAGRRQAASPKARVPALPELGTRVTFAWNHGPDRESKRAQATRLHPQPMPGMLPPADQGHIGMAHWRPPVQAGLTSRGKRSPRPSCRSTNYWGTARS